MTIENGVVCSKLPDLMRSLVAWHLRARAIESSVVLLDAHSVLDTDAGLFEISTDVMRHLDPLGYIVSTPVTPSIPG